jgi:hypothetical protein
LADVLTNAVAEVTALLRDQLFAVPLGGVTYQPAGRVSPYPPAQVTAPCAWVEAASGSARFDDSYWATMLDVVTVADGGNDAGWELLYALTDRAIALLSSRQWLGRWAPDSRVMGVRSRPVDVGGPSLRAFEVSVELYVPAQTMCSDSLTLSATPGGTP